jgi:hypothetical protein
MPAKLCKRFWRHEREGACARLDLHRRHLAALESITANVEAAPARGGKLHAADR